MKANLMAFFEHYELHATTTDYVSKYTRDMVNKCCKFCGKSDKQVSFKNIPHLIPELFGRNDITTNYECDLCNTKFQRYENDTATLIQHNLAILNIKSKRGVPTFQSKKSYGEYPTVLTTEGNNRHFNFNSNLDDFEYDEKKI